MFRMPPSFADTFFSFINRRDLESHLVLQCYNLSIGSNLFHNAVDHFIRRFSHHSVNESITSGHEPTAFKTVRAVSILRRPTLYPSDIHNYPTESLLCFYLKPLSTPSPINCLFISPRTTTKIIITVALYWQIPQKLPLWLSLRSFMLPVISPHPLLQHPNESWNS